MLSNQRLVEDDDLFDADHANISTARLDRPRHSPPHEINLA